MIWVAILLADIKTLEALIHLPFLVSTVYFKYKKHSNNIYFFSYTTQNKYIFTAILELTQPLAFYISYRTNPLSCSQKVTDVYISPKGDDSLNWITHDVCSGTGVTFGVVHRREEGTDCLRKPAVADDLKNNIAVQQSCELHNTSQIITFEG